MFESETPSLVTRFERQMGSHTCPGALTREYSVSCQQHLYLW